MSIAVMTDVWANSRAEGSERLILLAIADFADKDGRAYPSVQTLAQKARVSERTAQYCIRRLTELGELTVATNSGPRGCNVYTVQNLQGCNPAHEGGAICDRGGANQRTKGVQPVAPEPSEIRQGTVIEPPKADLVFPLELQGEDFAKAWDEWIAYRRERRLPKYKARGQASLLKQLAGWGRASAIASIEQSIRQNWQGLFEPRALNGSTPKANPKGANSRPPGEAAALFGYTF